MQFDQLERREVITFLGGAAVTTWTLVFFVYSGSGMIIQSSITGYSSYAECNRAGSNWMKNEQNKMKGHYCVSLKIKSGPRR
jgi:hypothetical protein